MEGRNRWTSMATIFRIADYKLRDRLRDVRFDRRELEQLLSVYSHRVINGEWKDYAIRHEPGMAAFHMYSYSSQSPSCSVVKRRPSESRVEFVVYSGRQRVRRSPTLRDALAVLNRQLRLV